RSTNVPIGGVEPGPVVVNMTLGPVLKSTFSEVAPFANPTAKAVWFKVWNQDVTQDYRGFAPLHGGVANILFADGSVRPFKDQSADGFLNNGVAAGVGGYADGTVEMEAGDVVSRWSLTAPRQYVTP
ncbi:MAG: DUF1559 domain-containing protein, partial [Planctomycetales bacterium]|nr:DUF1559 domain-containing protein [Planctomycetales bacterium]